MLTSLLDESYQGYTSPQHPRKLLPKDLITLDGTALIWNVRVIALSGYVLYRTHSSSQFLGVLSFAYVILLKIQHFLSQADAEELFHVVVTSRSVLLSGCTSKSIKILRLVQNAAARV